MNQTMQEYFNQFTQMVGADAWSVVKALAILVIGWLVALILAAIVRGMLRKVTIDNKIAAWFAGEERVASFDLEHAIGQGVFYLAMLFVVVAACEALQLTVVTEPLREMLGQVMEFAPRLFSAGALLGLAWLIATGVKLVVKRAIAASGLEKRIQEGAGDEKGPAKGLGESIGEALYWFIFLLFLPGVLEALALEGMMAPVQGMMNEIVGFLPNLFTAGITLAVGWLIARVVQRVTTSFTAAVGVDGLSERVGLQTALGGQPASKILGMVVYVFIFLTILIASLSALGLDAITLPLSNMLNTILDAVPALFGALLVLAVSFALGKVVSNLVSNLLASVGFNAILEKLGLGTPSSAVAASDGEAADAAESANSPSSIVGSVVLTFIMLFAATEAAGMLGFEAMEVLIAQVLQILGRVLFGLLLLGVGLFLANFVAKTIRASGAPNSSVLSTVARVAILVLVGAISLRQMGIANEIIELAFGLTLGAFAIASAIAFGIGGRDIAARKLESWTKSVE